MTLMDFADRAQISGMLRAFGECLEMNVRLIDPEGHVWESWGHTPNYCHLVQDQVYSPAACEKQYTSAARLSHQLGEAYIFACHGGLFHIAFPLSGVDTLYGAVLAGPFLMDDPDSSTLLEMTARQQVSNRLALSLYDEMAALPVWRPERVTQAARLMYYLFSSLIPEGKRELLRHQQMRHQQSEIGESIQTYKAAALPPMKYPYQLEKELISKVKSGDTPEAKRVLNDLLGYVLFAEGRNADNVRVRSLELCALLSRVAMDHGSAPENIMRMSDRFYEQVMHSDGVEDMCLSLSEIVDTFMSQMFHLGKQPEDIQRAIRYISQHFSGPLTLQEVADHVHLSPSYFSTLFHQRMGVSFREYVNQVRVEESKRLLSLGRGNIVEIAVSVGFTDQSYFSKVFRKYAGMSPKEWRTQMTH